MLDFLENQGSLEDFLKRHVKAYDSTADEYDRPPFTSDTKEGKNDSIYNAHSYHTKVPPRSIIPYILHYTEPGDLLLDLFSGSGMTGVATQMCANPPSDILAQFSDLKDRVGPRACILNDLSPAACHIAYNYNTPVDVEALTREFERIKAAVKKEFEWLYGTEHYEPAIGDYALNNPDVLARLQNPSPADKTTPVPSTSLLKEDTDIPKTWTLLSRSEVQERLGYTAANIPRDDSWKDVDVSQVEHWICIPATIQYTIWADVYRCEGFITTEESTGKISTRGKNAGRAIIQKKRVTRGCGGEIPLWDCAVDHATATVFDEFKCPKCGQVWTLDKLTLIRCEPTDIIYEFERVLTSGTRNKRRVKRRRRRISQRDLQLIKEIDGSEITCWFPTVRLVPGEQSNPFINRGIVSVDQVYTRRNLRGFALLFKEINKSLDCRLRQALLFAFTSILVRLSSRMTMYNFGKRGNIAMPLRLFIPHFQCETNVFRLFEGKINDLVKYFVNGSLKEDTVCTLVGPAQELKTFTQNTIDFIFTDPPFGRNIAYSELNIFWEAWLGAVTDVSAEAITSNGRKWGLESYAHKMQAAFVEMFRVLKPGRYAMVEFNNADPAIFEAIKQGALAAGFELTNMMILDKAQKSYNQVKGMDKGDKLVDKDVVFNLRKPTRQIEPVAVNTGDMVPLVAETVRSYLTCLPRRIIAEPHKYSDDNRTTATLNSILLNELMPRGLNVDKLTIGVIEQICSRYFLKRGNRWYLKGEPIGNGKSDGDHLLEPDIKIMDESTAVDWLRQVLRQKPLLAGELQTLWMKASGMLPVAVSRQLDLETLLVENFWQDMESKRWREPTLEEREKMNDSQTLRVLHNAERFLAGSLRRQPNDTDRCEWIEIIFKACRAIEDQETAELPALRDFDTAIGCQMISQLFHGILKDHVPAEVYNRVEKQTRVAASRLKDVSETDSAHARSKKPKDQMEMDL